MIFFSVRPRGSFCAPGTIVHRFRGRGDDVFFGFGCSKNSSFRLVSSYSKVLSITLDSIMRLSWPWNFFRPRLNAALVDIISFHTSNIPTYARICRSPAARRKSLLTSAAAVAGLSRCVSVRSPASWGAMALHTGTRQ